MTCDQAGDYKEEMPDFGDSVRYSDMPLLVKIINC